MTKKKGFFEQYKKKLVDLKNQHLERLRNLSGDLTREASGDVGDQARQLQEEVLSLAQRKKLETELLEIDQALERIKQETFGICEITGNEIEEKRLNAIPWTKLSLEGAEIQEMERKNNEEIA